MYYSALRSDVGRRYGHRLQTSTDFVHLSEDIAASKAGYISSSTLKRFWGYVNDNYSSKRQSTLDTLARYVGHDSYGAYIDSLTASTTSTSDFNSALSLDVSTLTPGRQLTISWFPDRQLWLTYLGNLTFRIDRSENSKLTANTKIRCLTLVKGQPLIVNIVNINASDSQPLTYMAGKVNGINWSVL